MMARKGRKRKFRKYLKGKITHDLSLGTLTGDTVVGESVADSLSEKAYLTSVKARWSLENMTKATNQGPIIVGVAHSDYSDAEIEAWLENQNSWESGDKIGQEVGRRFIREVGTFHSAPAATDIVVLNDGKAIHTKCGWMLNTGQTVKIWAYNVGSAALDTTVPIVHTDGHANLWPA